MTLTGVAHMLLGDGFWEIKNLNDVIAIVGLILTLLSIWLAVYFARRDLQRTIEAARRDALVAVERIALALLQRELGELCRRPREARDASRRCEWARAELRLDDAEVHIAAALEDPRLLESERDVLKHVADNVTVLRKTVAKLEDTAGTKTLPQTRLNRLDQMIRSVALLESRLRHRVLEVDRVRTDDGSPPPPPAADESGESGMGTPGG